MEPPNLRNTLYPNITDEVLEANRKACYNRIINTINEIKLKAQLSVVDRKGIAEKCNQVIENLKKFMG